MKSAKNLTIIILILLLAGVSYFLLLKPRGKEIVRVPVTVRVKTPQIEKVTDTVIVVDTIYNDRIIYRENAPDKELAQKYQQSQDTVEKLNMYLSAITERIYDVEFTDSIQNIKVHSSIRGELLKQSLSYTVYPQEVVLDTVLDVEVPKRIQLYGLIEAGAALRPEPENRLIIVKGGVIFKNKRDQLITLSIDSQVRGWVGFGFKF